MTNNPRATTAREWKPICSTLFELMSKNRAWIETTHHATEQRTEWRIVSDGEVLQSGNVHEDLAGTAAYDVAQRWARELVARSSIKT